jgi:hypothetical protein
MSRLFAWLPMIVIVSVHAAEPVMLGVLEEPQCAKDKAVRARIMFSHTAHGWDALDTPEAAVGAQIVKRDWTIALDGKQRGQLTLEDPTVNPLAATNEFYSRDKLFAPVGRVPLFANPKKAFGGWCDAPRRRPIVLVSPPNFADPAGWKRFVPGISEKKQLLAPLHTVTDGVTQCGRDGFTHHLFRFQAKDVKIYEGYRSNNGDLLIPIGLDRARNGCYAEAEPGEEWESQWFSIHDGVSRFVGRGMELVDAADYDGDGKTEFLFWSSGYDNDGYRLMFDGFAKTAEYLWSYH